MGFAYRCGDVRVSVDELADAESPPDSAAMGGLGCASADAAITLRVFAHLFHRAEHAQRGRGKRWRRRSARCSMPRSADEPDAAGAAKYLGGSGALVPPGEKSDCQSRRTPRLGTRYRFALVHERVVGRLQKAIAKLGWL